MSIPYLQDVEHDGEMWKSTKFQKTPIMSVYLLALTVTDFGHVKAHTVNETQVSQVFNHINK